MPGEHAVKRLEEISHLFLSSRESNAGIPGGSIEAALWLVIADRECNRAFIAAGVAEALSTLGIRCTLLEIGKGLPNVGYYFALEPADYLAPTLNRSRVVAGLMDTRVRFAYAARPGLLEPCRENETASDAPHVIAAAFRCPRGDGVSPLLSGVAAASGRFSAREKTVDGREPDGIVVFVDSCATGKGRDAVTSMRASYPDAALFIAARAPVERTPDGASADVSFPSDLHHEWGKRTPSKNLFFADIVTQYLQVVSNRRKKEKKRAAV
jgi:hypothetical protein